MKKGYILIIVLSIVIGFVLIGTSIEIKNKFLSAEDKGEVLSNVYIYDSKDKILTIEDKATIKLLTPLNNLVPRGYQKVAEYEIVSIEVLKIFISEMELYNIKDSMREINRQIDYKIKGIEQVEVNDYKEICEEIWNKTSQNNSIYCTYNIIGSHLEDRITWTDLSKVNFLKDDSIIVGLFTDVYVGDKVEWIPTFTIGTEDYRIEEWAGWEESLNVDLIAYYKLDESSGAVVDSLENFSGTTNADRGGAGIIDDSFSHVSANSDWTNLTTLGTLGSNIGSGMSVSLWIKTTEADLASPQLLSSNGAGSSQIGILLNAQTSSAGDLNKMFYQFIDASGKTTFCGTSSDQPAWRDGGWAHLVFTYDGSNGMAIFVDGASVPVTYTQQQSPSDWANFDVPFGLAVRSDGTPTSNFADIELDEVGIWNRNLTASEVTDLYNSGVGITWEGIGLIDCTFNGTVKDGDGNAINNSKIVILNAETEALYGNTTSDENGLWNMNVSVNGNYTIYAYEIDNITRAGDIFPYVECIMEEV